MGQGLKEHESAEALETEPFHPLDVNVELFTGLIELF